MSQIQQRKDDHLRICLEEEVGTEASTGLGAFRLEYDALPEIDLDDVDLSTKILGRSLQAPILIGSMTGGSEWAGEINHRIARVATRLGLGMGLGSQRAMLKDRALAETFAVRKTSPDLPLLIGNIGAVQLGLGVDLEQLRYLVHSVQADGLFFHLNPLQEAIQPEGDTQFRGLFSKMHEAIDALGVPCIAKEVGSGISEKTAEKLSRLSLAGVEASGVGGTSWARVEAYRAKEQSTSAILGQRLRAFGTPTAESILHCRKHFSDRLVIGSGGVRTGMDVAVALALGADAVALAQPVLQAATQSEEALEQFLHNLIHELKVICFCTGAPNIAALRQVRLLPAGRSHA
ncbi:MAG: type 2 isopentenyl-diphosphate Delta-isomerase [Myxococcales bacterium]|nr:type 2 isopentenyl-diphosphate Delta-isomerase [Myxococcales bacterium]